LSTLAGRIFCGLSGFFAKKAQNIPFFLKKIDLNLQNKKSGQTNHLPGFFDAAAEYLILDLGKIFR
jgi:hypothetical protein